MCKFSQIFFTITELVSFHLVNWCSLFTLLYYLLLITYWKCKIFCENYYEYKVIDLVRFNSFVSSPSRHRYLVKKPDMIWRFWLLNYDMTFTNWLIVLFGRFLFIFFSIKSNSLKKKMSKWHYKKNERFSFATPLFCNPSLSFFAKSTTHCLRQWAHTFATLLQPLFKVSRYSKL